MNYIETLTNINYHLSKISWTHTLYNKPEMLTAQNLLVEYQKAWPPSTQYLAIPDNVNPLDLVKILTARGWGK